MYCTENFRTKKALKDAVKSGAEVSTFQPGGLFPAKTDGTVYLEGPHYPAAHSWYASAIIKNGIVQSVK